MVTKKSTQGKSSVKLLWKSNGLVAAHYHGMMGDSKQKAIIFVLCVLPFASSQAVYGRFLPFFCFNSELYMYVRLHMILFFLFFLINQEKVHLLHWRWILVKRFHFDLAWKKKKFFFERMIDSLIDVLFMHINLFAFILTNWLVD